MVALETVTHISDLVATNPGAADPKSQGDDHLRNIKSALLHDFAGFTGAVLVTGVDGGAANAYTLTPANALVGYGSKMLVEFTPNADNTGAATLNVSGLGAKPIISAAGAAMTAGDLGASRAYLAAYDGASFRLISVTTAYVDAVREYASQLAFGTALPSQAGNSGKVTFTNGVSAFWDYARKMPVSARTANAMLVQADRGTIIDVTSGSFTQTVDACATLGDGWYCLYRVSGTGAITFDPNGAELIDQKSSMVVGGGELLFISCSGTALTTLRLAESAVGSVATTGRSLPSPAWLPCNGAIYDDAVYPALASILTTTYPNTSITMPTASVASGSDLRAAFSGDSVYMAIAGSVNPYVKFYKRSGDVYSLLADPASAPAGTINNCAMSADGVYLGVVMTA